VEKRKRVLLFIFAISFFGLYYSKSVLSVFPYLILLMGIFQRGFYQRLNGFVRSPAILSLSLIFFVYLFSGINSSNAGMWVSRLNTNLIFMVVPLGIYLLGPYSESFVDRVLGMFAIINFIISIYLLTDYFYHFEEVNSSYLKGQTIHTPIIHVRYSYFVALSIVFSVYLFLKENKKIRKYLYGFIAIYLIVFIHIMAVRTGILSLYLSAVLIAFYYAFVYKKYLIAFLSMAILIVLIVLSYNFLPSVKNKINYVKWDIRTTLDGSAKYHTSDRIRIYSIINGLKVVKDSPLLGSGIGDIEEDMDKKYDLNYKDLPKEMRFQPINQFVFTLSSMGIIGFVLFYGLLLFPLFYLKGGHPLLPVFYVLTFLTFLGETTIELMIGKTAFLVLLSLFICIKPHKS